MRSTLASKKDHMGYSIHIELPNEGKIAIDEWLAAVEQADNCRVKEESGHSSINPKTGETIKLGGSPGDAEIFDPDEEEWVPALHWRESTGSANVNGRAIGFEDGTLVGPIWDVIRSLAVVLGAQVRGDEGEVYDLETGKPGKAN